MNTSIGPFARERAETAMEEANKNTDESRMKRKQKNNNRTELAERVSMGKNIFNSSNPHFIRGFPNLLRLNKAHGRSTYSLINTSS